MHGDFFLRTGALLGALALVGWLFVRLRQSVVPAFLLLGMATRPWVPDSELISELGAVGVVLLLFFMGLEFSTGALLRDRRAIVRAGLVDLLICFPVGLAAGFALGAGLEGALILASGFYVSSSAIIAKSVIELRRAANPETPLGLGILVFEDLLIALLLAVLSGAVLAHDASMSMLVWRVGRAALFFVVIMLLAHLGRRLFDAAFSVRSDDVFLLMSAAVVILLSWDAVQVGLSEALGGFLGGLVLSETRHKPRAERLFSPLQGVFGAVFFFAFGHSIRLDDLRDAWGAGLVLVVLAIAVKLGAGWIAGRREGLGRQARVALGLMLLPRGEFTIILAGTALAAGMTHVAATLAILVVALSIVGTTAIRFTPEIAQRVIRSRTRRVTEMAGAADDSEGGGITPPM
ncbi:MAG TPA: cation:proton antiporter [Gemmatimonadaceae bacterium]|nr:cation:proton antiporter [Gemmatimonadaceae bacterium]